IKSLDARTASIDDQLNAIDDKVNAAMQRATPDFPPTPGRAIVQPPFGPRIDVFGPGGRRGGGPAVSDVMAAVMIEQAVAFVLLGFLLWRWARRRVGAAFARLTPEDAERIDQLQRSVDVMAVEVERIAEGQRYVAKVLSEKAIPAPR